MFFIGETYRFIKESDDVGFNVANLPVYVVIVIFTSIISVPLLQCFVWSLKICVVLSNRFLLIFTCSLVGIGRRVMFNIPPMNLGIFLLKSLSHQWWFALLIPVSQSVE